MYHTDLTLENGEGIQHYKINAVDMVHQNLSDHFEESFNIIDEHISAGNSVYVKFL